MEKLNIGYVFDGKVCNFGFNANKVALHEYCNILQLGDTPQRKVDLTFSLDSKFNLTKPLRLDSSNGLVLLETIAPNRELACSAIEKFIKSNKGIYNLKEFVTLICVLKGTVNMKTGEWSQNTVCKFYVPRTVVTTLSGDLTKPDIICDVAIKKGSGLNSFEFDLADVLEDNIKKTIYQYLNSKADFYLSRMMFNS